MGVSATVEDNCQYWICVSRSLNNIMTAIKRKQQQLKIDKHTITHTHSQPNTHRVAYQHKHLTTMAIIWCCYYLITITVAAAVVPPAHPVEISEQKIVKVVALESIVTSVTVIVMVVQFTIEL